jgi:hypothetical protein
MTSKVKTFDDRAIFMKDLEQLVKNADWIRSPDHSLPPAESVQVETRAVTETVPPVPTTADLGSVAGQRHGRQASIDRAEVINLYFQKLELAFPNRFRVSWPSPAAVTNAKRLYSEVLERYPADLLKAAFDRVFRAVGGSVFDDRTYMPDLRDVQQALSRLMISRLKIPTRDKAWQEVMTKPLDMSPNNWSHPAVWLAVRDLGIQRLREESREKLEYSFRQYYEHWVRRALNGEDLARTVEALLPQRRPSVAELADAWAREMEQQAQVPDKGDAE